MRLAMAWSEKPTSTVMMRQAELWVDETYTDYRNRGLGARIAREQTALDLGITPRRVQSFLEGYAAAICQDRWQDMRRRFLLHLENEAAYAIKRAAQRTERRRDMEQERGHLRGMRS
jgi:hypothetical protein